MAERIAAEMRFFHWELEFPDVFRKAGSGFDAILGNPPWDTLPTELQGVLLEHGPALPLLRQAEAVCKAQTGVLRERHRLWSVRWLDYNGKFTRDSVELG